MKACGFFSLSFSDVSCRLVEALTLGTRGLMWGLSGTGWDVGGQVNVASCGRGRWLGRRGARAGEAEEGLLPRGGALVGRRGMRAAAGRGRGRVGVLELCRLWSLVVWLSAPLAVCLGCGGGALLFGEHNLILLKFSRLLDPSCRRGFRPPRFRSLGARVRGRLAWGRNVSGRCSGAPRLSWSPGLLEH